MVEEGEGEVQGANGGVGAVERATWRSTNASSGVGGKQVASSRTPASPLSLLWREEAADWRGPAQCWAGQWAKWAAPGKLLSLSFSVFYLFYYFCNFRALLECEGISKNQKINHGYCLEYIQQQTF